MGQYYVVVNRTKREYLNPHKFGDGLKLLEFGRSGGGTMLGLAILLADGNNRGGGDLGSDNPIIGSWSGDSIVIAGDYADPSKWLDLDEVKDYRLGHDTEVREWCDRTNRQWDEYEVTLYSYAQSRYRDISDAVLMALCDDSHIRSDLQKRLESRRDGWAGGMPPDLEERVYGSVKKKRAGA